MHPGRGGAMKTYSLKSSMNMSPRSFEFEVLVHRERCDRRARIFVAQCMNADLVAKGETVSEVLDSLEGQ